MLSGKIELPHTFTYISDFAQAIVNVGNAADAFGQLWHAPNATAVSIDKWIHLFQLFTGEKVEIKVLPKFVVRIAGIFNSLIREFYELAYQFEYPYLVDHSKYTNRFGDHSTSPSVIVKETVQWYKKTKSII
jgi:nucleoside-diphosphate-sugar epimerase